MSFLLDTVVLSELRKVKPSHKVVRWIKEQDKDNLFISVVSIGEIERGIEKARKSEPEFASELALWLEGLLTVYAEQLLPLSAKSARVWGKLSAKLGHEGADLLIAAAAITHGLTVATRNVKHFETTGVTVINPFD